jgi:hypothetical protein
MFDLEAAIQEAVAAHHAEIDAHRAAKADANQRREAERQQYQADQIDKLRAGLITELGLDLFDALTVAFQSGESDNHLPSATLTIDGEAWRVRGRGTSGWYVVAPLGDHFQPAVGDLRQHLLIEIACERQRRAHRNAERAEQEHQQAEQQAEHARCLAQITEAVAAARRHLWQWPEGREVTIYRWSWQVGASDYGTPSFDHGWSASDRLDGQGYVTLHGPRHLRLLPDIHRPVVERHTFSAVAQLPYELHQSVSVELPDIEWRYTDSGEQRYYEQPGACLTESIGSTPVAWVQALIDS